MVQVSNFICNLFLLYTIYDVRHINYVKVCLEASKYNRTENEGGTLVTLLINTMFDGHKQIDTLMNRHIILSVFLQFSTSLSVSIRLFCCIKHDVWPKVPYKFEYNTHNFYL